MASMFSRYWGDRFFPARYWPNAGAEPVPSDPSFVQLVGSAGTTVAGSGASVTIVTGSGASVTIVTGSGSRGA